MRKQLSCVIRKPDFCKFENKGVDQLCGDQRLCFRYINSKIPLLPKFKISSLVCAGPGQLVGNHEDRFSCDTAQLVLSFEML